MTARIPSLLELMSVRGEVKAAMDEALEAISGALDVLVNKADAHPGFAADEALYHEMTHVLQQVETVSESRDKLGELYWSIPDGQETPSHDPQAEEQPVWPWWAFQPAGEVDQDMDGGETVITVPDDEDDTPLPVLVDLTSTPVTVPDMETEIEIGLTQFLAGQPMTHWPMGEPYTWYPPYMGTPTEIIEVE